MKFPVLQSYFNPPPPPPPKDPPPRAQKVRGVLCRSEPDCPPWLVACYDVQNARQPDSIPSPAGL